MKNLLVIISLVSIFLLLGGCRHSYQQHSDSGVEKATFHLDTNLEGKSIEQENYIERQKRDNQIGSVKHLYIISSYSGDVLEYSTVRGKVTSGGKRLSPKTVHGYTPNTSGATNYITIGGREFVTDEVLGDDGTYGESANYIYWFDANDNYHQYFPSGGTFVHICDHPLRINKVNLSLTLSQDTEEKK